MPYAQIDDALRLVAEKFYRQTDEEGEPYVLHCLRVMMSVADPEAQLVALMHDLIEDTDVRLDELREMGFSESVVEAIDLVTHRPEDSYAEYVMRIKHNPLARQVKLADLQDNAALSRVLYRKNVLHHDLKRIQRYVLSYQFLSDRINEDCYRTRMLEVESWLPE